MPSAAVAHFMSKRSDLIVIERAAVPVYEHGQRVGTTPGKLHTFSDHYCKVEGVKAIEFMRERARNGLEVWELDGASDVRPLATVLAELATADVDRVREILAAESDGPARAPVLDTCRAVLDKLGVSERKSGGQPHEVLTG